MPHREQLEYELLAANKRIARLEKLLKTVHTDLVDVELEDIDNIVELLEEIYEETTNVF